MIVSLGWCLWYYWLILHFVILVRLLLEDLNVVCDLLVWGVIFQPLSTRTHGKLGLHLRWARRIAGLSCWWMRWGHTKSIPSIVVILEALVMWLPLVVTGCWSCRWVSFWTKAPLRVYLDHARRLADAWLLVATDFILVSLGDGRVSSLSGLLISLLTYLTSLVAIQEIWVDWFEKLR